MYLILVSLLLGNASSKLYNVANQFDQVCVTEDCCAYDMVNNDSIVLQNVPLLFGALGYRVEWWVIGKVSESSVLLGSTLGYNPFLNTVTFGAGQLTFHFDQC